jgi:hypothetical protein
MGNQSFVEINNRPVRRWDGNQTFAMFLLTIDRCRHHENVVLRNQGSFLHLEDYLGILWPGINNKDASNCFHVTKRSIAEIVQSHAGRPLESGLTIYKMGLYILSSEVTVYYDVGEFEAEFAAAMEIDSLESWIFARNLYHGPYLAHSRFQGHFGEWVAKRQQETASKIALVHSRIAALTGMATT